MKLHNNRHKLLQPFLRRYYSHREWEIPRMMDLILVRHGESEGNVAYNLSRNGDHSLYSGEFLKRHSSQWRLTDEGREQAKIAGEFIRKEMKLLSEQHGSQFQLYRHYVSEYIRAQETAARLELPNARWFSEERDWGQMDLMSWGERVEKMGSELNRRDLDRFLFAPPGGESMADVAFRTNSIIAQLHRECADRRVVVVCHGEVMWAMRTRLERMDLVQYRELTSSSRVTDHIHNGQILWYTRKHPDTGDVSPFFSHVRSVCPWDLSKSTNKWIEIGRPIYTDAVLLANAERVPRLINHNKRKATHAPPPPPSGIYRLVGPSDPPPSYPASTVGASQSSLPLEQSAALHVLPVMASLSDMDSTGMNTGKCGDYLELDRNFQSTQLAVGVPLEIKNVLVVERVTRLEVEKEELRKDGIELMHELSIRGLDYMELHRRAEAHNMARDNIISSLIRSNIYTRNYKVNNKILSSELLQYNDVVFTAGGDSTFLRTAILIKSSKTPLLGINTDPSLWKGSLCCSRIDMTGGNHPEFDNIIKKLQHGDFRWMEHDRLRITMISLDGTETVLPYLALNEVLIGVGDPSKTATIEANVDDQVTSKVKCSGLLVCTGTGSSGWYESATRVHSDTLKDILDLAGITNTKAIVEGDILKKLHLNNLFAPNSRELGYIFREPMVGVARKGWSSVGNNSRRKGRGTKMLVKCLDNNGQISIDGVVNIPFKYGSQFLIEVAPEGESLKSVRFHNMPSSGVRQLDF